MFSDSKAKESFRVVVLRDGEEFIIEAFDRESDAKAFYDKATAEDSFLFQIDGGGEYVVSYEVPETVWRPVAKRVVLGSERCPLAHPVRRQGRSQQARRLPQVPGHGHRDVLRLQDERIPPAHRRELVHDAHAQQGRSRHEVVPGRGLQVRRHPEGHQRRGVQAHRRQARQGRRGEGPREDQVRGSGAHQGLRPADVPEVRGVGAGCP